MPPTPWRPTGRQRERCSRPKTSAAVRTARCLQLIAWTAAHSYPSCYGPPWPGSPDGWWPGTALPGGRRPHWPRHRSRPRRPAATLRHSPISPTLVLPIPTRRPRVATPRPRWGAAPSWAMGRMCSQRGPRAPRGNERAEREWRGAPAFTVVPTARGGTGARARYRDSPARIGMAPADVPPRRAPAMRTARVRWSTECT